MRLCAWHEVIWGNEYLAPLILNLGIRWRRVSVLRFPHLCLLYDNINYHIMFSSISRSP